MLRRRRRHQAARALRVTWLKSAGVAHSHVLQVYDLNGHRLACERVIAAGRRQQREGRRFSLLTPIALLRRKPALQARPTHPRYTSPKEPRPITSTSCQRSAPVEELLAWEPIAASASRRCLHTRLWNCALQDKCSLRLQAQHPQHPSLDELSPPTSHSCKDKPFLHP